MDRIHSYVYYMYLQTFTSLLSDTSQHIKALVEKSKSIWEPYPRWDNGLCFVKLSGILFNNK